MTSKERLLKTINNQKPDRPPIYCSVVPQLAEKLSDYFGVEMQPSVDSPLSSNRISWNNLMIKLGADCVCVAACAPDDAKTKTLSDGLIVNEWGVGMRNHGLYDDFALHPLADAEEVEDILNYKFPDVNAVGRFRHAEETIAKYGEDYGVIGDLECSIFEIAWYLVGLEKLLMDMATQEPYVDVLFDKIAQYHIQVGRKLAMMGADIIWCGDDLGTQSGTMISTEMFDRYFAPRIRRMFESIKEANPKVKIAWHSCGSILPLIPKFIDLGLDILNPIQPLAAGMDPQWLKDTYGDKLVFFGGICVQKVLPEMSVNDVKINVRRCIDILGKNGGYILAPAHNIQADTPLENIFAMFEAATH